MVRVATFFFWGNSFLVVGLKWLCWAALVGLIFFSIFNNANPNYVPSERAALEAEAKQIAQGGVGQLQGTRWWQFIQSPQVECHYKPSPTPQEFLLHGPLQSQFIIPNTGQIYFLLRFSRNLSGTLFGSGPDQAITTEIVNSQRLYFYIIKQEGFRSCTVGEINLARSLLGLPKQ
jgi:hypothetical protein